LGNITATNATLSGNVTASSGNIGGWTINATRIYTANAYLDSGQYISFGSTPPTAYGNNVGVWLGYSSAPKFSLYADANNYLQWDGSKLLIKATNFQLDSSGNIISTSGNIGGWSIGATALTAGTGATTVGLDSGGTNPAIYAGSATPASAPFRVNQSGEVWMTNAHIECDIQSTYFSSGFYGWKIEQNGHAEFNDITLRGNIESVVFAKTQINTVSGDIFVTDGAVLIADIVPADTAINVDNDSFLQGDVVKLATGSVQEWMGITDNGIAVTGGYQYSVDRDLASGGLGTFYRGDIVVRSGSSTIYSVADVSIGDPGAVFGELIFGASIVLGLGGYLDLNGSRGLGPYFGVFRRYGSIFNQVENIARFGNMNGFLGYSTEVYGIGIGDLNRHLSYTYDDGLEIKTASGDTLINDSGIATSALIASLSRVLLANLTVGDTRCFVVSGYLDAGIYSIELLGDSVLEIL
jgi:hypothetical protein